MGKTISSLMAVQFLTPAQVQFQAELQEASAKRQERAELLAAVLAGIALGVIVAAINVVFPFIPS